MFCNSFHWYIFKLGKKAVFYNCIKPRKSISFRIKLCYPANKVGMKHSCSSLECRCYTRMQCWGEGGVRVTVLLH